MGKAYDRLFVAEGADLDERVAAVLDGLVWLSPGKDGVIPGPRFDSLPADRKLLVFALAKFALSRSGQASGIAIAASSEEFAGAAGLNLKTCRNLLSTLKGRRLLDREGSGYLVAPATAHRVISVLSK